MIQRMPLPALLVLAVIALAGCGEVQQSSGPPQVKVDGDTTIIRIPADTDMSFHEELAKPGTIERMQKAMEEVEVNDANSYQYVIPTTDLAVDLPGITPVSMPAGRYSLLSMQTHFVISSEGSYHFDVVEYSADYMEKQKKDDVDLLLKNIQRMLGEFDVEGDVTVSDVEIGDEQLIGDWVFRNVRYIRAANGGGSEYQMANSNFCFWNVSQRKYVLVRYSYSSRSGLSDYCFKIRSSDIAESIRIVDSSE